MANFMYITKLNLTIGVMPTLLALILFLTFVFYLYSSHYRHNKRFMKFANEIPGPRCYPVVGSAYVFGTDPNAFLENVSQQAKYGRVSGHWIGPTLYVGLFSAEDIGVVMAHTNLLSRSSANDMMRACVGDGLITLSGEEWKKHRKILLPTFHSQILRHYVEDFISKSKILNDLLEPLVDKPSFNIIPFINNYTYDALCETLMASKSNAQMSGGKVPFISSLQQVFNILMDRFFRPWMYFEAIFKLTSIGKTFHHHVETIHNCSQQILQQKLKTKATIEDSTGTSTDGNGKKKRKAFLDFVLEVDNEVFSEKNKIDECNTMMVTAFDTTSVTLGFLCLVLSRRFDVQEKIVDEIKDVLGSLKEKTFTFDDVKRFSYLEKVIKETLRLFPPLSYFPRKITEDVKLPSGYTLPSGCSAIAVIMHAHRDPTSYPNPNVFDPDNFLPQRVATRHPFSYCPFGGGPRNCIGQQYAMLQLKSFLICLLRRYWLIPTDFEMELVNRITMNSKNGINIGLKKRTGERPHVPNYETLSKRIKTNIEFFNVDFKESY